MSLKKYVQELAPVVGTAGGAIAGGVVGGPAGATVGAKLGGTIGKGVGTMAGGKYASQSASSLPQAKSQDRARLARTQPNFDAPMPSTPPFGGGDISDAPEDA